MKPRHLSPGLEEKERVFVDSIREGVENYDRLVKDEMVIDIDMASWREHCYDKLGIRAKQEGRKKSANPIFDTINSIDRTYQAEKEYDVKR